MFSQLHSFFYNSIKHRRPVIIAQIIWLVVLLGCPEDRKILVTNILRLISNRVGCRKGSKIATDSCIGNAWRTQFLSQLISTSASLPLQQKDVVTTLLLLRSKHQRILLRAITYLFVDSTPITLLFSLVSARSYTIYFPLPPCLLDVQFKSQNGFSLPYFRATEFD